MFGLFLRWGDKEAVLGYRDFLGGLEELKTLPLKDQQRCLKNEVFRVSSLLGFFFNLLLFDV